TMLCTRAMLARIESRRSFSTTFSDSLRCGSAHRATSSRLLIMDSSGVLISWARLTAISPAVASCSPWRLPRVSRAQPLETDPFSGIVMNQRPGNRNRNYLAGLVQKPGLVVRDPARRRRLAHRLHHRAGFFDGRVDARARLSDHLVGIETEVLAGAIVVVGNRSLPVDRDDDIGRAFHQTLQIFGVERKHQFLDFNYTTVSWALPSGRR